jgi:hypothetical protein
MKRRFRDRKYMSLRKIVCTAGICLIFCLSLPGQEADPGRILDNRMHMIAGENALDCGRVKLNSDPNPSLSCLHKAISKRRPFFVRFDVAGTDSVLSDGFAGDDSGKVYSVRFDSLGWVPAPDVEIVDDKRDAVEICPKPVRIKKRTAPRGVFFGYRCAPEKK